MVHRPALAGNKGPFHFPQALKGKMAKGKALIRGAAQNQQIKANPQGLQVGLDQLRIQVRAQGLIHDTLVAKDNRGRAEMVQPVIWVKGSKVEKVLEILAF